MRRLFSALFAGTLLLLLSAPTATAVLPAAQGPVIVSLTFDGGYKGQEVAAKILETQNMAGTFYINSEYIGYPAFMSLEQLRGISRERHEIGGASTLNNDLTKLPIEQARAEVCNDRATLDRLGFRVTSFAYPLGADSAAVRRLVSQCGYNSARDVSGLFNSANDCSDCPAGETIPPTNDFRVRTSESITSHPVLKARVMLAESKGGGWVPLVFRHVCVCPDKGDSAITPADLTEFVKWLSERPATTKVRTVDQVVGGEYKPVKGQPVARLVAAGATTGATPSTPLSSAPAWAFWGLEIGQTQIIALSLVMTITIVLTYRAAARGNRYAKTTHRATD